MSDNNQEKLPKNWVQRVSKSRNGKIYYFNIKTKQSVWKLSDVFNQKKTEGPTTPQAKVIKNHSPDKKLRKIQNPSKFTDFYLKKSLKISRF